MRHLKFNYAAYASRLRREEEIQRFGKQLFNRGSKVHSSKKDYKRNNKINIYTIGSDDE